MPRDGGADERLLTFGLRIFLMEGKDSSSWVIYDVWRRVLRRGMPWRRGSCVFDVVSFFFFFQRKEYNGDDWPRLVRRKEFECMYKVVG